MTRLTLIAATVATSILFVGSIARAILAVDATPNPMTRPAAKSGKLEFHILADAVTTNPSDVKTMEARLQSGGQGPLPLQGDTIRWVEVKHPEEFDHPGIAPETREWKGKHYLPLLVTEESSMDEFGQKQWGFAGAHVQEQDGVRAVAFNFDDRGRKIFADFTTHWYKHARQRPDLPDPHARLAIVLDNKIISAPQINSPITAGSGVIEGGSGGFSDNDLDYLINSFNAGSSSATSQPSTDAAPLVPRN